MPVKFTVDDIQTKLSEKGLKLIDPNEYQGTNFKATIGCNQCGNQWEIAVRYAINGTKGCSNCSVGIGIADLLTQKGFIKTGNRNGDKREFQCSNGHTWYTRERNIANGSGCPECTDLDINEVINKLHPKGITIVNPELMRNISDTMRVRCVNGHEWDADMRDLCRRDTECQMCTSTPLRTQKAISKMNTLLNEYGLHFADAEYIGCRHKHTFSCSDGHTFQMSWNNLQYRYQRGCLECKK